jgi:hypothetical protein
VQATTKEYGSSWIFELGLTWANALRRVQHSAFVLGNWSAGFDVITSDGAGVIRHARADRAVQRSRRLPAPKPDRVLLSPARMANGAGQDCLVVVRGCPPVTVEDCCEARWWHGRRG